MRLYDGHGLLYSQRNKRAGVLGVERARGRAAGKIKEVGHVGAPQ